MSQGPQYLLEQAAKSAAHLLQQANTFTRLHIKQPLFQKRMGKGADSLLTRFDYPGVLSVIDPITGIVMAASEPGRPDVLSRDFVPVVPALLGSNTGLNSNKCR